MPAVRGRTVSAFGQAFFPLSISGGSPPSGTIVALDGSYVPLVALAASYQPLVAMNASYIPNIELKGENA